MPNARQFFEETFRPAKLLIEVYRLLDNDGIQTEHDWIKQLRPLVGAGADEELMLLWNGVFLGLVMEAASVRKSSLRRDVLKNLLRQSIVCGCTAMESFLQVLLEEQLETSIRLRRYEVWSAADRETQNFLVRFNLGLEGALSMIFGDGDASGLLARKLMTYFKDSGLGTDKAVKTVGVLLGLNAPWEMIADHLVRDEQELIKATTYVFKRRNDIVHRGDREKGQETGPRQDLTFEWTKQSVETVENICLTLGELVQRRIAELRALSDLQEEPLAQ